MTRRGLLGGTFDPIHVGHLDVARAAADALALDQVMLVPSHVPPHREAPRASAAHRFAMAVLASQGDDRLVVSDLEMEGAGPSYTSALLDRLEARGEDASAVFFITGADAFRDIATWKHYPAILDRCHFVAVSRPGCPASSLRTALPALADRMRDATAHASGAPAIFLVNAPTAPVSSTEVRHRVAAGLSIAAAVPRAVAQHIEKHGLYQS
jgi:nicotinate-nucleotide adenylyltransferase